MSMSKTLGLSEQQELDEMRTWKKPRATLWKQPGRWSKIQDRGNWIRRGPGRYGFHSVE